MSVTWKDSRWQANMSIHLDYANMLSERLGRFGLKREKLAKLAPRLRKAGLGFKAARTANKLPFFDLPYQTRTVQEVTAIARATQGRFDSFVGLGIGGSALGNLCLHSALNHFHHNELSSKDRGGRPRIYIPDNVDPDRLSDLLDVLDLKKTLINVITKSGNTAETMSQLLLIVARLKKAVGEKNIPKHLIVTTDPNKGDLRAIARELGLMTLAVPDGVGGRFSVLSAVGLLSAAISGIDVEQLLAGAAAMDRRCMIDDPARNPAMTLAGLLYLSDTQQGRNIHVMMPYSNRLYLLADWFRQLWAESLGKKLDKRGKLIQCGPTPVKALGATDQHSQVQLYMEGPRDKVLMFLRVGTFDRDLKIPALFPDKEATGYLGGRSFGELLNAEQTGTETALTLAGRANLRLDVPAINPYTLGQLLYLLEATTAFAGELYGINAFDQPGVEAGKEATFALMGRKGFEAQRAAIGRALKPVRGAKL